MKLLHSARRRIVSAAARSPSHMSGRWVLLAAICALAVSAQPVELTQEHADLRVVLTNTSDLAILVRNSDTGQNFNPTNVVLVVGESAKLTLPADLPPLGNTEDPIWVLPASQNPELLYLGISGDGLPIGSFDSPIRMRFLALDGPGNLFLWQTDAGGGLVFQVNTADGIDDSDAVSIAPGGHSHHNWGFATNGIYRVTLRAEGHRSGVETNDLSPEAALTFHVLPLPPPEPTPFQQWQRIHWPEGASEAIQGPDADPDGDGVVNAMEYALDLDPRVSSRSGLPAMTWRLDGGSLKPAFQFTKVKSAADLGYRVAISTHASGPWASASGTSVIEDLGATEKVTFIPDLAADSTFFLRLEVTFNSVVPGM